MKDKPLARAAPGRLDGRQPKGGETFRVMGRDNKPLLNADRKAVDGGGYRLKNLAELRAAEINEYYAKHSKPE